MAENQVPEIVEKLTVLNGVRQCAGQVLSSVKPGRYPLAVVLLLLAGGVVSGCAVSKPSEEALSHLSNSDTPDRVSYCFGHGCRLKAQAAFVGDQWQEIRALFETVETPAQEREALAAALGRMETIAGEQNGTENDRAGTYMDGVNRKQLDCIDEAVNASNFIGVLEREGLLVHHTLRQPVLRSWVSGNILHATAVIAERDSGALWSVDSSFFPNGANATISPLPQWKSGWVPEGGVN